MLRAGGPSSVSSPGIAQAKEQQQFVKLQETLIFAFFFRTFAKHGSVVVPEVHSQVKKGKSQRRKMRRWLLDGFLLP